MAGDTVITIIGNLTSDPELRFTPSGAAVADLAEHVAGSLVRGSRVMAQGRLKQRSFETKEGEKRTVVELEVDEIGPSLRYATASVTKVTRSGDGPGGGFGGGGSGDGDGRTGTGRGGSPDPWAAPVGGLGEEPPF
jgi:single-strand DNA-binding protein